MTATTIFSAPDISCGGCANAIKKALGSLSGVSGVEVDVTTKKVTVAHDTGTTAQETLIVALDRAGFPASVDTNL